MTLDPCHAMSCHHAQLEYILKEQAKSLQRRLSTRFEDSLQLPTRAPLPPTRAPLPPTRAPLPPTRAPLPPGRHEHSSRRYENRDFAPPTPPPTRPLFGIIFSALQYAQLE